jgi:hypothetical protein
VISYLLGTGTKAPTKELTVFCTIIIIASEIFTVAVTVALGMYSKRVRRRAATIIKEGNFHSGLDARTILPGTMLAITVQACILSFVLAAFACLYTAWRALR